MNKFGVLFSVPLFFNFAEIVISQRASCVARVAFAWPPWQWSFPSLFGPLTFKQHPLLIETAGSSYSGVSRPFPLSGTSYSFS